jgi:hypothetical protein
MRDTNEDRSTTTTTTTRATTTTRTWSRYTGPSAARIADLIAPRQRVRFERGWFWTAAVCHESEQDTLGFRQRPDGDGIDVRCSRVGARDRQSAGCRRERIIQRLETLAGESIWSAYGADPDRSETANEPRAASAPSEPRERNWSVILAPFVLLLLAAPLAMGFDPEVVALNAFGLGWAGWLVRRVVLSRRVALAKAARKR